jgi:tetratricopeptide (TPR) repeat protein
VASRAALNLASILIGSDPVAAAIAGRAAMEHARQLGDRFFLPTAVANLAVALLLAGDWDEADEVLRHAIEIDGFDDESLSSGYIGLYRAALPALRGDIAGMSVEHPGLTALQLSEDPQDRSAAALVEALRAAARQQLPEALQHTRIIFDLAGAVGIAGEFTIFAWPLAVRLALELGDSGAVDELLAVLDGYPVGHIPALLRAERSLVRARLRAAADDPGADGAFAEAIEKSRSVASPYHLAHALLDYADYLFTDGRPSEAQLLRDEARAIGGRLGARPLVERADATAAADVGQRG